MVTADTFSRVSKVWVDHGSSLEEAQLRRRALRVALACGDEIRGSRTLQAAFLTAVATATRCFPGAVALENAALLERTPSLSPGVQRTLLDDVRELGLPATEAYDCVIETRRILFGSVPAHDSDLQVTFDGWIGAVGPAAHLSRLSERERTPLAGVLSGAQAVAELFFAVSEAHPEASFRVVARSLWRPDLGKSEPDAVGPLMDYVPAEFWISGLGHLGQAYCWTIGLLPFSDCERVHIALNDFDRVVDANVETGLLTRRTDVGRRKTRVVAQWLENRGFATTLVERAFDEHVRRQERDPRLALFGFDGTGPRAAIESPGFPYVIDTGVGGTRDSYDSIATFTFPHPSLKAATIWAHGESDEHAERAQRLAQSNAFYQRFRRLKGCGEIELAGTAISVPFVGAAAAAFALAEAGRAVLGGPRVGSGVVRLATPSADVLRVLQDDHGGSNAVLLRAQNAASA